MLHLQLQLPSTQIVTAVQIACLLLCHRRSLSTCPADCTRAGRRASSLCVTCRGRLQWVGRPPVRDGGGAAGQVEPSVVTVSIDSRVVSWTIARSGITSEVGTPAAMTRLRSPNLCYCVGPPWPIAAARSESSELGFDHGMRDLAWEGYTKAGSQLCSDFTPTLLNTAPGAAALIAAPPPPPPRATVEKISCAALDCLAIFIAKRWLDQICNWSDTR